ncbi:MAG: phosphatase PAP2 family protein [Planctomycetes bacterium]|nr:phosphatase PAP2 family protein [Planctomycetota bacterium]
MTDGDLIVAPPPSRWSSLAGTITLAAAAWWILPALPAARATYVLLVLLGALRAARELPCGLAMRPALLALAGMLGFVLAWQLGHAVLFSTAEKVRELWPVKLETVMSAIPGNRPEFMSAVLAGERFLPSWSALYQHSWLTVPLLAMLMFAARGRTDPAVRIALSHLVSSAIAIPIFVLVPIPDPWYGVGWFGQAAPPWWQGIADHVVTAAFPSLHLAVATAVVLAAARCDRSPLARAAWIAWATLVACSTLALRTHWLIDLPAGVLVGVATDRLAGCILRAIVPDAAAPAAALEPLASAR